MPLPINYPLFRKYINGKNFFKIISPDEFEEIQLLGKRWTLYHFKAKILPDRNLIHDLTFNDPVSIAAIKEFEYEEIKKLCEN